MKLNKEAEVDLLKGSFEQGNSSSSEELRGMGWESRPGKKSESGLPYKLVQRRFRVDTSVTQSSKQGKQADKCGKEERARGDKKRTAMLRVEVLYSTIQCLPSLQHLRQARPAHNR